jgi:hypothetical protein
MFAYFAKRGPSTEIRSLGCVAVSCVLATLLPRLAWSQCCNCDVDADGVATVADLAGVVACFGPAVPPCVEGDLNCDGLVDPLDVAALDAVITGILPGPIPMPAPAPEPGPVAKNRFISLVVPPAAAANEPFAIRVDLTALPPAYAAFVGEFRYVNTFPSGLVCLDDGPPFLTSYACATLGCAPQYLDWATLLGGATLHVSGSAVMPGAGYDVSFEPASCMGFTVDCNCYSPSLAVATAAWGDIASAGFGPPDGAATVLDIPPVVNKLKSVPPFFAEPRTWLKQTSPAPNTDAITVVDLSDVISAMLGMPYARPIVACPAPVCCPPPSICP